LRKASREKATKKASRENSKQKSGGAMLKTMALKKKMSNETQTKRQLVKSCRDQEGGNTENRRKKWEEIGKLNCNRLASGQGEAKKKKRRKRIENNGTFSRGKNSGERGGSSG